MYDAQFLQQRPKPILDLVAEVTDLTDLDARRPEFEAIGYVWRGEYGIPGRRYIRPDNNRVHWHCYAQGSEKLTLGFRPDAGILTSGARIRINWRTLPYSLHAGTGSRSPFVSELKMAIKKDRILEFGRSMHAALVRIMCIFIGIYLMGFQAFFSFYFLHMILTSLIRFYTLDSDADVQRMVRSKGSIGWQHLGYISSLHLITSLLILALYWTFITLFDRQIAPGTLDMGFAKLYALIIFGNLITPLTGIIKAKAPQVVQEIVLRGQYAVTLVCIVGFVVAGVDAVLLPYAWLLSSLALAALRIAFALHYLWGADIKSPSVPLSRQRARDLWQSILSLSAVRTDRRVTFLGAKAVISTLLGPFASLTLKAVGFNDDTKRQRYATKVGKRWPVRQLGRRLSGSPVQRVSTEQVLWCILLASTTAFAVLFAVGGRLDPFLALGSLALSCKILAISLRALLLRKLTS